jgi:putative aminopeptidase FrvX
MRKESKKFLRDYLNANSPVGAETPGQKVWLDYLKPYIDKYEVDTYGTVVGVINPGHDYKVVIEAHADEIAWYVNYIDSNGYIYVIRNGGSDHQIAPSMRVHLHTENGKVDGVFGWPAIHVRDRAKEEQPSLKNLTIDVGASNKEEVLAMSIDVGTVVTFDAEMMELNNKYVVARALDNRGGGFMIAEVARLLKENKNELPFTLYVVNSVQEEIGLRGAEMISRRLKPNVAIVTDVTHDTQSPMYNKKLQGDTRCGGGPAVTTGPAVQNNLLKLITDTATKNKISVQRQAASRSTGTDTDAFAYSDVGVASALISLPLKYMHTTVETVAYSDIEDCIQLMYHSLLTIEKDQDFRYFK